MLADAQDPARRAAFSLPRDLPRTPAEGLARAFALCAALEPEIRKHPERLRKLGVVGPCVL